MPDDTGGLRNIRAVHFAIQNGRHKVCLCDPSRLCNDTVPWRWTDDWKHVNCLHCVKAREEDTHGMKADIQDRMNRKGFAHKS